MAGMFDFLGSALGGLENGLGKLGNAFGFNFGGGGVNSQLQPLYTQQQFDKGITGITPGTSLNQLNQGIINNNNLLQRPNANQFLFGSNKNIGALPALGNLYQTIGGLNLANKQFQLGKDQINLEKEIYNNRQQRLVEDSSRYASNILKNSPSYATASDEYKKQFIDDNTQSAKFI